MHTYNSYVRTCMQGHPQLATWCTCPHIAMYNSCTCVCALIVKSTTFFMISHDHLNYNSIV